MVRSFLRLTLLSLGNPKISALNLIGALMRHRPSLYTRPTVLITSRFPFPLSEEGIFFFNVNKSWCLRLDCQGHNARKKNEMPQNWRTLTCFQSQRSGGAGNRCGFVQNTTSPALWCSWREWWSHWSEYANTSRLKEARSPPKPNIELGLGFFSIPFFISHLCCSSLGCVTGFFVPMSCKNTEYLKLLFVLGFLVSFTCDINSTYE